jgi:uncharacterized membrane protein YhaH (DUF805 family)
MSDAMWFCAINGKQEGPFTVETLISMSAQTPFRPDTLVWSEGMAGWKPLSETPLFDALPKPTTPPSVPLGNVLQAGAQNVASQMAGATASMTAAINAPVGSTTAPGFVDAIKICFSKYVDFNGRASRPEYWWFFLFSFIVSILTMALPIVSLIAALAFFLPSLAVAVRRLHDIDKSGWWLLLLLLPLVGFIVLIVFLCQGGTQGQNRFG